MTCHFVLFFLQTVRGLFLLSPNADKKVRTRIRPYFYFPIFAGFIIFRRFRHRLEYPLFLSEQSGSFNLKNVQNFLFWETVIGDNLLSSIQIDRMSRDSQIIHPGLFFQTTLVLNRRASFMNRLPRKV